MTEPQLPISFIFVFFQGKLSSHIQNPNAAELVHYLIMPLSLLVRCTKGYEHSGQRRRSRGGGGCVAVAPPSPPASQIFVIFNIIVNVVYFQTSAGQRCGRSSDDVRKRGVTA